MPLTWVFYGRKSVPVVTTIYVNQVWGVYVISPFYTEYEDGPEVAASRFHFFGELTDDNIRAEVRLSTGMLVSQDADIYRRGTVLGDYE